MSYFTQKKQFINNHIVKTLKQRCEALLSHNHEFVWSYDFGVMKKYLEAIHRLDLKNCMIRSPHRDEYMTTMTDSTFCCDYADKYGDSSLLIRLLVLKTLWVKSIPHFHMYIDDSIDYWYFHRRASCLGVVQDSDNCSTLPFQIFTIHREI